MRARLFVGQFADRTGSETAALAKNAELARYPSHERHLLLDQQHSKPCPLVQSFLAIFQFYAPTVGR